MMSLLDHEKVVIRALYYVQRLCLAVMMMIVVGTGLEIFFFFLLSLFRLVNFYVSS